MKNSSGIWLDTCTSTNDEAKSRALSGAPHGFWIAAKKQTNGRGRHSREWVGIEQNLFFSMILRPRVHPQLGWVPILSGLATLETALSFEPNLEKELFLKWPNDLWAKSPNGYEKWGGVLCEGALGSDSKNSFIVVGIGVNLIGHPEAATSLDVLGCRVAREEFAQALSIKLLQKVFPLIEAAPSVEQVQKFKANYHQFSVFKKDGTIEWGSRNQGCVYGLGDLGQLQVKKADGKLIELFSEEVSVLRPVG